MKAYALRTGLIVLSVFVLLQTAGAIDVAETATTDSSYGDGAESGTLSMSLKEFLKQVKEKYELITVEELEWKISNEAIENARAVFEPEVRASYKRGSSGESVGLNSQYFI